MHGVVSVKAIGCLQVTLQDPHKTYEVAMWSEALQEFGLLLGNDDVYVDGIAERLLAQSGSIEFVARFWVSAQHVDPPQRFP